MTMPPAAEAGPLAPRPGARLDTLTALRFFAAIAIVFHHLADFGLVPPLVGALPLDNGVSFFFVLSGFVMFHVHGDLEGGAARRSYLVARIARIYPLHLATFALLFILLDGDPNRFGAGEGGLVSGVLNVLLLQAWVPIGVIFFGFNSVSWTISVEMFFYVAFIGLVTGFNRRWPFALAGSALLVIGLSALSDSLNLAQYDDPMHRVNAAGLLYINPLARLFEFVVGMCIALAYRRHGGSAPAGRRLATAMEAGVLLLLAANLALVGPVSDAVEMRISASASNWFLHGGTIIPSTALLIYVFALQRGWVSALLRLPALVLLGEISFSIYLVHQILLRAYATHIGWFAGLSPSYLLPLYFAVLLVVSALLWRFVEVPARHVLRAAYARRAGGA